VEDQFPTNKFLRLALHGRGWNRAVSISQ
jgi:hypothetical protein